MNTQNHATSAHARVSNVVSLEAAQRARLSFVASWRRTIMRGDRRLSVYARSVACALAERMDAQGECWPGLEKIATEAGCSKRKAQDAIAELVEAGYLRTERKQSNHYFAVNARVAGDAPSRVAQRATEGNQESKGAKAPLTKSSTDLGNQAIDDSRADAPVVELTNGSLHHEETVEAEKLGSWQTLQEQNDETNQPTDEDWIAVYEAIEAEEQAADDYEWTEPIEAPQEGSTVPQPAAQQTEPNWTAYSRAVAAALEEAKREGWMGVGRLDDMTRWHRRLEELGREFGVDS